MTCRELDAIMVYGKVLRWSEALLHHLHHQSPALLLVRGRCLLLASYAVLWAVCQCDLGSPIGAGGGEPGPQAGEPAFGQRRQRRHPPAAEDLRLRLLKGARAVLIARPSPLSPSNFDSCLQQCTALFCHTGQRFTADAGANACADAGANACVSVVIQFLQTGMLTWLLRLPAPQHEQNSSAKTGVGTPIYMAPEIIYGGNRYDAKVLSQSLSAMAQCFCAPHFRLCRAASDSCMSSVEVFV